MTHIGEAVPGSQLASATQAKTRFWTRKPALVTSAAALSAGGYGIGSSSNTSAQQSLSQERSQLATMHNKLSVADDKLSSGQAIVQSARTQASQAGAEAQAKYASQEAALGAKEKAVRQDERAVNAMEGRLQAAEISADGVYVVGQDIKSGTWHTPDDGGQNDDACYFATLNSTNTSDISDNNNFDGPKTVSFVGVEAFQISVPCTWYRVGG
jgi:hypothetical protein